jgi:hypothetical protein
MESPLKQSAYKPFNTTKSQIRLLQITSVNPDTVCELRVVSLLGSEVGKQDITLDGTKWEVTANLHDAPLLIHHHWQRAFPGRELDSCQTWTDALCINQDDFSEREQQVLIMCRLFRRLSLFLVASTRMIPPFIWLSQLSS